MRSETSTEPNTVWRSAVAEFRTAWEFTREAEGLDKLYDDPRGGKTRWGISQKLLDRLGKSMRAEDLSEEDAEGIAREIFWDWYHYDEIDSQPIATRIFDLTFLHGPAGSHKAAQRAWNCLIRAVDLEKDPEELLLYHPLEEDGIFGKLTHKAIAVACTDGPRETAYLAALIAAQCGRLEDLDDERHERGWINRVLGRK